MPELPKGLEEAILEDIRNREDVSADALPSAIFYTFVNTHQALNCAGFSRTGAYVAGAILNEPWRTRNQMRRLRSVPIPQFLAPHTQ